MVVAGQRERHPHVAVDPVRRLVHGGESVRARPAPDEGVDIDAVAGVEAVGEVEERELLARLVVAGNGSAGGSGDGRAETEQEQRSGEGANCGSGSV